MRHRLEIKDEARHQLRALPRESRRNIGWRLDALLNDLAGDVKKLSARSHEYRLRVGSFRVLCHAGKRFSHRVCYKRPQASLRVTLPSKSRRWNPSLRKCAAFRSGSKIWKTSWNSGPPWSAMPANPARLGSKLRRISTYTKASNGWSLSSPTGAIGRLRVEVPNFFGYAFGIRRINSVWLEVTETAIAGTKCLRIRL